MKSETRDKLMGVSVATLCSALYKRGLKNQTIQDVRPVRPKGRNMVGPAFTLRYMPAREDRNPMTVFRDPKHPQRHAIETCPEGHVLVMDSRKDARAASAGDILITRLMVRGRFWEFKKALTELELREALIFQDRDWTQGNTLVDPASVARCPFAVNDLMGSSPSQSGAFGKPGH